jgi:translation initiation factor 3 subunit H
MQNGMALSDFPAGEMFTEIPIYIKSPAIVEAFLVDWSLMDPVSTTQIEALDTENQVFLERNMQLLIGAMEDLAAEQQKLQMFERQAGPDAKGKGKGQRYRQQQTAPRQLDTMILSQQIQNYCKQINDFSGDSFGKLFLLSNKPSSLLM